MSKDPTQPYEFKDTYQFRFTRKIADGGMGSIYEAHLFGSEGFEKTVTIKTIREKFTGDHDFEELPQTPARPAQTGGRYEPASD